MHAHFNIDYNILAVKKEICIVYPFDLLLKKKILPFIEVK